MLAERIPGCRFLDLFAGSGVVGMEAWSRGAAAVTLVERDRGACARMRLQVAALMAPDLPAGPPQVIQDDVIRWLRRLAASAQAPYDLVFADPPYAEGDDGYWERQLADGLTAARLPAAGGHWVLESRARRPAAAPSAWVVRDERTYGGTLLRLYQKREQAS